MTHSSFFPPFPYWGMVLKVAFVLSLKLVTLFPVTGWESYLVSPESLFESKNSESRSLKTKFHIIMDDTH